MHTDSLQIQHMWKWLSAPVCVGDHGCKFLSPCQVAFILLDDRSGCYYSVLTIIEAGHGVVNNPAKFRVFPRRDHRRIWLGCFLKLSGVSRKVPDSVMPVHVNVVEDVGGRHPAQARDLVRIRGPHAAEVSGPRQVESSMPQTRLLHRDPTKLFPSIRCNSEPRRDCSTYLLRYEDTMMPWIPCRRSNLPET